MNGKNINDLSISFSIENKPVIKITYEKNSNKKNRDIFLGITIASVGLLIIVIIISCIIRYYRNKQNTNILPNNNINKIQKNSLEKRININKKK